MWRASPLLHSPRYPIAGQRRVPGQQLDLLQADPTPASSWLALWRTQGPVGLWPSLGAQPALGHAPSRLCRSLNSQLSFWSEGQKPSARATTLLTLPFGKLHSSTQSRVRRLMGADVHFPLFLVFQSWESRRELRSYIRCSLCAWSGVVYSELCGSVVLGRRLVFCGV